MDEKLKIISEFCKKSGGKFSMQCTVYDDGEVFAEGGLYFEEFSPCYMTGSSVEEVVDNSIEFIKSY